MTASASDVKIEEKKYHEVYDFFYYGKGVRPPTNFYVSSAPETTPDKPICFFADDSIVDFLHLVSGAIRVTVVSPENSPGKKFIPNIFKPQKTRNYFLTLMEQLVRSMVRGLFFKTHIGISL